MQDSTSNIHYTTIGLFHECPLCSVYFIRDHIVVQNTLQENSEKVSFAPCNAKCSILFYVGYGIHGLRYHHITQTDGIRLRQLVTMRISRLVPDTKGLIRNISFHGRTFTFPARMWLVTYVGVLETLISWTHGPKTTHMYQWLLSLVFTEQLM